MVNDDETSADAVDGTAAAATTYAPVVWHWFYLKEIDKTKRIWYSDDEFILNLNST